MLRAVQSGPFLGCTALRLVWFCLLREGWTAWAGWTISSTLHNAAALLGRGHTPNRSGQNIRSCKSVQSREPKPLRSARGFGRFLQSRQTAFFSGCHGQHGHTLGVVAVVEFTGAIVTVVLQS
jgi:hypothetical protein